MQAKLFLSTGPFSIEAAWRLQVQMVGKTLVCKSQSIKVFLFDIERLAVD
jgi:hypothetical protein